MLLSASRGLRTNLVGGADSDQALSADCKQFNELEKS
jgi:hypothetical protein